jgi:hypothetical protein
MEDVHLNIEKRSQIFNACAIKTFEHAHPLYDSVIPNFIALALEQVSIQIKSMLWLPK